MRGCAGRGVSDEPDDCGRRRELLHPVPTSRAPRGAVVPLVIGLRAPTEGRAALEEAFWAVSDPSNPDGRYGKHLSREEVRALLHPGDAAAAVASVICSLDGVSCADSPPISYHGHLLHAEATVEALERITGLEYYTHEIPALAGTPFAPGPALHRIPRANLTGAAAASFPLASGLPADVAAHVDMVHPTTHLPHPRNIVGALHAARDVTEDAGAAADGVTPAVIRTQYGIGDVESTSPKNRQQVAGFLGEFASQADLDSFYEQFYPTAKGRKLTFVGPNDQAQPGLEASLDVQYATTIGANVNTTYWYTDGGYNHGNNEPFTTWFPSVLELPDATFPYVISVSYGDNEDTVPADFAQKTADGMIALGARGASILFSSGDGGVAGSQSGPCTTFIPTFPAGMPYVTAVGGTTGNPETAASFSSGGFSNVFFRPASQVPFVKTYLSTAKNLPPAKDYNATGNGIPDVSALSESFNIICSGSTMQVDGTSCAAPTFAGLVSLLNDLRLQAGKAPLGFLNTLFYTNPDVFTDVTEGNNPGCGTNGFEAAKGWDPITGLGSPSYEKLKALVMSLP